MPLVWRHSRILVLFKKENETIVSVNAAGLAAFKKGLLNDEEIACLVSVNAAGLAAFKKGLYRDYLNNPQFQ